MENIFHILHIVIIIALISIVLLQKTSSDGLSGLAGANSGLITGRTSNNTISKITIFLAFAFMANSLFLAKLSTQEGRAHKTLINELDKKDAADLEAPKVE